MLSSHSVSSLFLDDTTAVHKTCVQSQYFALSTRYISQVFGLVPVNAARNMAVLLARTELMMMVPPQPSRLSCAPSRGVRVPSACAHDGAA